MNQCNDPHENKKKDHKFRCYCWREYKSLSDLNTHRRSCFVGKAASMAEFFEEVREEINDIPTNDNENNLGLCKQVPYNEYTSKC